MVPLYELTPPIATAVFKVASRCNLACTYCYMYTGPDQSWREQPPYMSSRVVEQASAEIARYAKTHELESFVIVVHGGEPLLAGPTRLRSFFEIVSDQLVTVGVHPEFVIQTNATLIDSQMADLLAEYRVLVGVSIDGTVASHNRRRLDRSGKGSFDSAIKGSALLRARADSVGPYSAIAVIDISADPEATLKSMVDQGFTRVEFLLPDLNWDTANPETVKMTGDWLVALFDSYMDSSCDIYIRAFQLLMKLFSGGLWGSDGWGERSAAAAIIETDGSYHYHDVLKTAYPGASDTGETVWTISLDDLAARPMMKMLMNRLENSSSTCKSCTYAKICGGGQLAHRYSSASGFLNPSVYCVAIKQLLEHIQRRMEQCPPILEG